MWCEERRPRAVATVLLLLAPLLISSCDAAAELCPSRTSSTNVACPSWEADWGGWWTLFLVYVFGMFGFIMLVTLFMLGHEGTYKKLAFKSMVLYLNLAAVVARLLYLVDPETFLGIYSVRTVIFLQRMPQIVWLTETLLFIALWKRVYDAYSKAERITSRVTIGRYKYSVSILSLVLLGGGSVTCTLQALNIEVDLMQTFIIGLFAVYVMGFLIFGGLYSIRLYYVMRKRTVKSDTFASARAKLSRTVTVWLVVGVVWAAVFLWKTLIGNLNDFQYLIYYAVLRTLESVVSIGALSAIVPSGWTFFIPDWIVDRLCCRDPPPTQHVSLRSHTNNSSRRRLPMRNRAMSLSSDLENGRKPSHAEAEMKEGAMRSKGPGTSTSSAVRVHGSARDSTAVHEVVNPLEKASSSSDV